jgi:nicastrin
MLRYVLALVIFSQISWLSLAQDEIFNKIYTFLDTSDPCLLFLNASGAYGCQGSGTRVSGAVIGARNQEEYLDLTENGAISSDAVALVIDQTLLNKTNLVLLNSKYNIAGAFVTDSLQSSAYSPDVKTGFNVYGDGLRFEKFQFPMFYISDATQIQKLYEYAEVNKNAASSGKFLPYLVQFTFPALATENSKSCLDEQTCFPVGDFSVWSTIGNSVGNSKEIVLVSTQLDSVSIFPTLRAPGSESAASAASAVFGIATSLAQQVSKELLDSLPRQILIAFFQAEAFDNTGSRRFIHDVDSFVCKKLSSNAKACSQPIRTSLDFQKFSISNISHHFSVSQVGLNDSGMKFFSLFVMVLIF